MGFLTDIGGRIGYGMAGILLTVTGVFLIYLEFKSQQRYSNSGSWPAYPFIILILGLACIGVAFSKNKKPGIPEQKKEPGQPAE